MGHYAHQDKRDAIPWPLSFTREHKFCYESVMKHFFYVGFGLQLLGIASVGLCLFSGIKNGDYAKFELAQLLLGSFVFYVGHYLRAKGQS